MAKFKAPADVSSITIGDTYNVDDKGFIDVPDDFTAEGLGALAAHGFTPAPAGRIRPAPSPAATE